jgi:hypothetical protein
MLREQQNFGKGTTSEAAEKLASTAGAGRARPRSCHLNRAEFFALQRLKFAVRPLAEFFHSYLP